MYRQPLPCPAPDDSPGHGRAPSVPTRNHGQQLGAGSPPSDLLTSGRAPLTRLPPEQGFLRTQRPALHRTLPPRSRLQRNLRLSTEGVPGTVWEVRRETERPNRVSAGRSPVLLGLGCTLGPRTEQARQSLGSALPCLSRPHLARFCSPGSSPLWTSTKLLCIKVPNSEGGDTEVGRVCTPAHNNGV